MKKIYNSPKMEIEYFRVANNVACDASIEEPPTIPYEPDDEF